MIVAQARHPAFYIAYGVPDTVTGRFDMIVLHLYLYMRQRGADDPQRPLAQAVFDRFCSDMDHNMREMGISDLAVPKRMREVGEAFYGRVTAYDRALAAATGAPETAKENEPPSDRARDRDAVAPEKGPDDPLTSALARNIFPEASPVPGGAGRLAAYVRTTLAREGQRGIGGTARPDFPDPEAVPG